MIKRCKKCNGKSSFLLDCKCGNSYCVRDLLPEKHKCVKLEEFKKEAFEKNKLILTESAKKEKVDWIT